MEFGSLMKTQPKVSIGMPVYNGEKYIRDALNSLLSQTFTDFELIISDNASSDGTESVCREYANRDSRIIYFRQNSNIGASCNFEFVLNAAKADNFMWAAYDDVWSKNYLFDAIQLLNGSAADFVFPSFELRSIQFKLSKKFNMEFYRFIESSRRRDRVLQFIALHHASHKCNIVYSLFRTEFLKNALKIQSIQNDAALGAEILGLGYGKILSTALFSKRYHKLWPGLLMGLTSLYNRENVEDFECEKKKILNRYIELFPEYSCEINLVFDRYQPSKHDKFYRI